MVVEGEVEAGKLYTETDFNRIIEIKAREKKRVKTFLDEINQNEKTIVFCATQNHAAAVRDLVNQYKTSKEPNYCVRVTANDGALGEQYLRDFRNNENTIPTILTSSQKLSTGVDARNIRNIIIMRPINSIIEFKQIIGRGTRLFEGKEFFTIYDFVGAYQMFLDPEWDGEPPEPPEVTDVDKKKRIPPGFKEPPVVNPPKEKLIIKLSDGKERAIQHMMATSFWSADGKPISSQELLENLFGKIPAFFKSEDELRAIWSTPSTRKALLEKLAEAGYGKNELEALQGFIEAESSDIFDVLEYVSFAIEPITREARVAQTQATIFRGLDIKQKEFLDFVLAKYIETGVEELDQKKLPQLLELKYNSLWEAEDKLGSIDGIVSTFIDFQKFLYGDGVA
jgi:type I restriction enzyme R subunit